MASGMQSSGMLSKEQLFHLFERFAILTAQPGTLILFWFMCFECYFFNPILILLQYGCVVCVVF